MKIGPLAKGQLYMSSSCSELRGRVCNFRNVTLSKEHSMILSVSHIPSLKKKVTHTH